MTSQISAEFTRIFQAFQRCLDLRDKYMRLSRQWLGDNPRDHDGHFAGLPEGAAGVSGMRPDADPNAALPTEQTYAPWRMYPRPPAPHWHWTDDPHHAGVIPAGVHTPPGPEEFQFESCEVPEEHPWTFGLDERGVYQVYGEEQGASRN